MIKISDKFVGKGQPCFIIAEAGVNHNGDIELAKKLILEAARSGADAIKFQTFSTDNLIVRDAPKAQYQKQTTLTEESQYEMLKKLELNKGQYKELVDYANHNKIIFLSTPYDEDSVDLLYSLNVPAYKIASCDLTNIPLIDHIADKNKPIIISTGMATMDEVETAVLHIKKYHDHIVLLHCTTEYPTKLKDVNLQAMIALREKFDLPIGYSDHTDSFLVSLAAVSLGANIIEKHFTLDKSLWGPDHTASADVAELAALVKSIRDVELSLGSFDKKPTKIELKNKKVMRRSICANRDIKEGEIISKDMISIKRPGIGLEPKHIAAIIGKKINKDIAKDNFLTKDYFREREL